MSLPLTSLALIPRQFPGVSPQGVDSLLPCLDAANLRRGQRSGSGVGGVEESPDDRDRVPGLAEPPSNGDRDEGLQGCSTAQSSVQGTERGSRGRFGIMPAEGPRSLEETALPRHVKMIGRLGRGRLEMRKGNRGGLSGRGEAFKARGK